MAKRITHADTRYHTSTKEYKAWQSMKNRCTKPKTKHFENYGGRGITVCDRWLMSYENFLADMGRAPTPQHSLDRIENNGNYTPENCRWATKIEQANNKRDTIYVKYNGGAKSISEVSRELQCSRSRTYTLLKRGELERVFK